MKTKIRQALAVAAATLAASLVTYAQAANNTLAREQIEQGWILLFDGETMFGWAPRDDAQWVAENGTLTAVRDSGIGTLSTTTEFADY